MPPCPGPPGLQSPLCREDSAVREDASPKETASVNGVTECCFQ